MILRRPYKILIRYFKPIHIIMFFVFVYFAFVLRNISVFFTNYVKSGNFIYSEDMVKDYVPWYYFLLILLVIVGTTFIYSLMKKKDKPVLYYRILFLYSLILLGTFVYYFLFFLNAKDLNYEPLQAVISRDISTFIYIVNYFYVGFSFIRGFGFDLKKFDFNQDKKEFELDEADNEEFEVNVEIDKKDIHARVKRGTREIGYIVKENIRILIIIGIIIFLSGASYLYVNYFVINKIYKMDENVVIGNVAYKVEESYLTNIDKYGDVLKDNFVLVNININNNGENTKYSREKFRIKIGDKYYYPVTNYYTLFDDLGNYYDNNTVIKTQSSKYLLVFNVGEEKENEVYLEILKNSKNNLYSLIRLNPILDRQITYNLTLNDEIDINNTILSVTNFEIVKKTSYQYNECINNICSVYTKTIVPNLDQVVLSINIKNSKNLSDSFWKNSLQIKYDEKKILSKDIKILERNMDTIYLGVSKNIVNAHNLSIIINTRKGKYNVYLRG